MTTKLKVIWSIAIAFILILIGFLISNLITANIAEANGKYSAATQINADSAQFANGMNSNLGNTLVYGQISTDEGVTLPELNEKFLIIVRTTQRYETSMMPVTYSTGKMTYTMMEPISSWNDVNEVGYRAKTVKFLNKKFDILKFELPEFQSVPLNDKFVAKPYLSWIKDNCLYKDGNKNGDIRYRYTGLALSFKGTIFANLKNNSIFNIKNDKDPVPFYWDKMPKDIIKDNANSSNPPIIIFWVAWSLFIVLILCAFIGISNHWADNH